MKPYKKYDQSLEHNEDQETLLIYSQHKSKLEYIWNTTDICNIITLIGIIVFLFVFMLKLALMNSFSWFYLLLPALLTIIPYTISVNLLVRSIDIISEQCSWFKYIIVNLTTLSTVTYLVLFCFKMEKLIITTWLLLSLPLFMTIIVASLFLIFLIPDYIANKYYFETTLILIYIIAIFIFTYLINYKIDNLGNKTAAQFTYINIFIVLFLATGLHFVYSLFIIFSCYREKLLKRLFNFMGVLFLIISLILIVLILEKSINLNSYVPVLILLLSIISFAIFIMFKFFSLEEPYMKSNESNEV